MKTLDILETDQEAETFMEDTYQFTDACEDLIMTVSRKKIEKDTEQKKTGC